MSGADRSKKSVLGHIQAQHHSRKGLSPKVISFNSVGSAWVFFTCFNASPAFFDVIAEAAKVHLKDDDAHL
eukprot:5270909-Karenia_brevis.AAC.1